MPDNPRGLFLSLDGLDGTGKSTHCRLLAEWLRGTGREVVTCADPGSTPLGDKLRELIFHPPGALSAVAEAMLFMASRAQLVHEVIQPALAGGRVVISDRFLLANVVYQGYGAGLPIEPLRQVGLVATEGLLPDATFVLDLPIDKAGERRRRPADRIERRDVAFHQRVREGFLAEAKKDPARITVIDAAGEPAKTQELLRLEVRKALEDKWGQ